MSEAATDFWKRKLSEAPRWDLPDYSAMQSWSVGMFMVAMKFAELYADERLSEAQTPAKEKP